MGEKIDVGFELTAIRRVSKMSSIEFRFNAPVTGQEVSDVFKRSGIVFDIYAV